MQKFLTGALAAVSTAALSVSTALASPAATLLRTEYERQQQALPLFERDHLIAEPGLLVIAILLAIYLVWKLRRDMRKRDEADRQYREMIAEAERLQAEEDEAKAAAEANAALEAAAEAAAEETSPEVAAETVELAEETEAELETAQPEEDPEKTDRRPCTQKRALHDGRALFFWAAIQL